MIPARIPLLFVLAALPLAAQTVSPNTALSADALASRFLAQATFGPSPEAIAELRAMNYDYSGWIDAQVNKPPTYAAPLVRDALGSGALANTTANYKAANRRARNQAMLAGADQLRQRVAYALSQILVISDVDTGVLNGLEGSSDYYDLLVRDAFAPYRQLLGDVTRHPMMGRYLSYYRNQKGNPATGTRPDENYARESMQLFTVGLYNLNPDGTYQNDATGRPVETYTNANITEHARVYTGFTDEDNNPNAVGTGTGRTGFPRATANYIQPMKMWDPQHDADAKNLLRYSTARKPSLPAGQTGLQDIGDLLDNLVEHPNTGPFLARLLIQRLVTSNPSNAYVGRVAAVFADNGRGQRGDLLAVIKAILLDNEARATSFLSDPEHGKLREPFLRVTHVLRACHYTVSGTTLPYDFGSALTENNLGQFPLASPSVFNFYLPDYQPPGVIENAGLVGPEYQILNSVYAITLPNALLTLTNTGLGNFTLDLTAQAALADTPSALVDNVDLLLTHGTMSAATRQAIVTAVSGVTTALVPAGSTLGLTRARLAVYLTAVSPDYAVQK
jgi:uncharacterized protein (DUF1800 family)